MSQTLQSFPKCVCAGEGGDRSPEPGPDIVTEAWPSALDLLAEQPAQHPEALNEAEFADVEEESEEEDSTQDEDMEEDSTENDSAEDQGSVPVGVLLHSEAHALLNMKTLAGLDS